MGEEKNPLCRKIPNNLCSYFTFKEGKHNPQASSAVQAATAFLTEPCERGMDGERSCTGEKIDKCYFGQVMKLNINKSKMYLIVFTFDRMRWKLPLTFVIFLPKIPNPNLIMRKYQTNPNRRASLRIPGQSSSRLARLSKTESASETVTAKETWQWKVMWHSGGDRSRTLNRTKTLSNTKRIWIICVLYLK